MFPLRVSRPVEVIQPDFSVSYSFPVYFTEDVWEPTNTVFADAVTRLERDRRHRLLFVIDSNVAAATPSLESAIADYVETHSNRLQLAGSPVLLPGGEMVKHGPSRVFRLLQRMDREGLDRQSFVVAVGGGAVLDAASFAAAICHRSVRLVRVPTTVLSQCDSGIAVKNGVNLFGKKNFIGTFVPPFAVINDSLYLETLPPRERIGGLSEVVKVALLRDLALFEYVEAHAAALARGDLAPLAHVTRRSAELHLQHICNSGDPFEFGSARPLDFGHWSAHKLESITRHRLRHGEAVAIGMSLDLLYAVRAGYLHAATADRVLTLLESLGFALWDEDVLTRESTGQLMILKGLREFQEHLGGRLHVTLIRRIGDRVEVTEMDEDLVVEAVMALRARQRERLKR